MKILQSKNGRKSNNESFRVEHDKLVKQIILAISALDVGRFWEQPTGAAYRNGVLIRYGLVGCADISGLLRGGCRVEIEVKTGNAKQSEGQIFFESMIHMMGGIYFVARSVDDALSSLQSLAATRE